MALSKQEVEHIAKLARLTLTDEEKEKYSRQLSDILAYVDQLNQVDTASVDPTSQVTGLLNVMREDERVDSEIEKELVACSPETVDGFVKIPKIFENK